VSLAGCCGGGAGRRLDAMLSELHGSNLKEPLQHLGSTTAAVRCSEASRCSVQARTLGAGGAGGGGGVNFGRCRAKGLKRPWLSMVCCMRSAHRSRLAKWSVCAAGKQDCGGGAGGASGSAAQRGQAAICTAAWRMLKAGWRCASGAIRRRAACRAGAAHDCCVHGAEDHDVC
jgi:hypothetical protein